MTVDAEPPTFDGPAFAAWLKRWMDAHDLRVPPLAAAAGLHTDTIFTLRRGGPATRQARLGQQTSQVNVNTLARLAHGLGLPLAYVLSKGGLGEDEGRWAEFSPEERQVIALGLGGDPDNLDAILRELTHTKRS